MTRRSGLSSIRLFTRQILADRGAGLVVLITVVLVAGIAAAWPRVVEQMMTDAAQEAFEAPGPRVRDVVAVTRQPPLAATEAVTEAAWGYPGRLVDDEPMPADEVWGELSERLGEAHDEMLPLLRDMTDPARTTVAADEIVIFDHRHPEFVAMEIRFLADPDYQTEVAFVEGRAPDDAGFRLVDPSDLRHPVDPEADIGDFVTDPDAVVGSTFEIALSAGIAERFDWDVGEVWESWGRFGPVDLLLTGVFEPTSAGGDYWQHVPTVFAPILTVTDPGIRATVHAYVAPELVLHAVTTIGEGASMRSWFPLGGEGMRANDVEPLISQLRAFNAETFIVDSGGAPQPAQLRWNIEAVDPLSEALEAQTSASALIMMVAAGPVGVALAVLALATRLVAERRRTALGIAAARGASPRQLRMLMAAEGVLLGLVPAVVALILVERLVPGAGGAVGWALPILIGLVPALALTLAVRAPEAGRRGGPARARLRTWLHRCLDAVVLGAAGIAAFMFQRRGLDSTDAGDPLLILTPLLVTLALCLLVLRLYPVALRWVAKTLSRLSGTVAFVGATRAGRESAAAAAPVLALVIGLSIAVYSSMLWSTTQSGAEEAAWHDVGADLRATSSQGFDHDAAAFVHSVDGVEEAVAVLDAGTTDVQHANTTSRVRLLIGDTAALNRVQHDVPEAPTMPDGLDEMQGEQVMAVGSDGLFGEGDATEVEFGSSADRVPVTVAETAPVLPGLSRGGPWLLVDAAALEEAGMNVARPRSILIRTSGPVDREALATHLAASAPLTSPADRQEQLRSGALAGGMSMSFVFSVAVAGMLAVAAVMLAMSIGTPARTRLLSVLRTVGISGRQAQGLVIWELAPLALVAMLSGLAAGLALPGLVLSGVDLRPFTGGAEQPALELNYGLVGWTVAGFVAVVTAAVCLAVLAGRRLRLGEVLRVGEER